ncbi:MAG: FecR domain-containing protein [Hyphomicrobium sp.]|nr:FecR domain-containing protein [Hyphomicrobium sp.]
MLALSARLPYAVASFVASFVTLAAGSVPAGADEPQPIGATLSVINVVTAEYNRDTRTLATGDNVRQNELIDVSQDASTELKLNDDTKLALGPGAKLMLDKFVYDPDQATGSIGVDLVQGAFRFMTGVAQKPSYVVRTPRASITVRGTIFDVYVEPNETTWLLLHEGGVRVCNDRGDCRDHDEAGKLIRITPEGNVSRPTRWATLSEDAELPFDMAFPFVGTPPTIDPTPIFSRDDIVKLAAITPDDKPSKKKPPRKADKDEDSSKPTRTKEKPKKVTSPKPEKKKTKTAKKNDNEAAEKALGLAIGVGIGIGMGKMGGGGRSGGGKHHPPRGYAK